MKKLFLICCFLFLQNSFANENKILGLWFSGIEDYGQVLEIKNLQKDSFDFTLEAMAGMQTGNIEGKASFKNKTTALFQDEENCTVKFIFKKSSLELNTSEECYMYGGMNISFGGEFNRDKKMRNFK